MLKTVLFSSFISFLAITQVKADITVFDNAADWQVATDSIVTEDFEDQELVSNLSVTSDNGTIDNGLWNDTVSDPAGAAIPLVGGFFPDGPDEITTWTYDNAPTAWSTLIDLAPGGDGSGLEIDVTYTDNTTESLGTINDSGFLGFVSDDKAIATIEFSTVRTATSSQEQHSLDNFASGFAATTTAVPEPCATVMLSLSAVILLSRRRRLAH